MSKRSRFLSLAFLALLPFSGCLSDGGTEIPNEVRGTVHTEDGSPVSGAKVTLFAVDYVHGEKSRAGRRYSGTTDDAGTYLLKKVPAGTYNLLAEEEEAGMSFRDSIVLASGATRHLSPDTLRAPGSITGTVRLLPGTDPSKVTVQILGTDEATGIDSAGDFTFEALPQGEFSLRVKIRGQNDEPLLHEIRVISGRSDTLDAPVEPTLTGLPLVSGLTGTAVDGVVRLRWNKVPGHEALTYVVYFRLGTGGVSEFTTGDTSYAIQPETALGDTAPRAVRAWVGVLDEGSRRGPVGEPIDLSLRPAGVSGRWHLAAAAAPFGNRYFHQAFAWKDRLWVAGGHIANRSLLNDLWSSADGISWRQEAAPPAGTGSLSIFRDTLWKIQPSTQGTTASFTTDGVAWTLRGSGSLPDFPYTVDAQMSFNTVGVEFLDQFWLMGGYSQGSSQPLKILHAGTNLTTWAAYANPPLADSNVGDFQRMFEQSAGNSSRSPNAAVLGSTLYLTGGCHLFMAMCNTKVWSTSNGRDWQAVPANFEPRFNHSLTSHAGSLWLVGGQIGGYGLTVSPEVWRSWNGAAWTLVDVHAPFGRRNGHAAVSFQGRLWMIGGLVDREYSQLKGDVWYYE
jgi:hypothetical protein